MDMRFFWITDQVKIVNFDVQWHPGKENRADYYTKHFDGRHHQAVRPWYLHEKNSPRVLPRAAAKYTARVCWKYPQWIQSYVSAPALTSATASTSTNTTVRYIPDGQSTDRSHSRTLPTKLSHPSFTLSTAK